MIFNFLSRIQHFNSIDAINKNQLWFFAGTIFLFFTLNAFCTFFMLTMKSFTIFQLIEKVQWVLLSALGIFALCLSTESTNKAISDCTTLLSSAYSHDALESINHKADVGVLWGERMGVESVSLNHFFTRTFFYCSDWDNLHEDHHSKPIICFYLWIFRHQHGDAALVCVHFNHLPRNPSAVQLWVRRKASLVRGS